MRYSAQVRPISYLKANAAQVLHDLNATREPMLITQNGEARAILQDVVTFEQTQETLALLKILAIGNHDIDAGNSRPAGEVIARLKIGDRIR
jgi:prevent-host-death family protein